MRDLVAGDANRDVNALARYYLKFKPLLISDAKKIVGNLSDAEEVVQEAFLYLMTSSLELANETDVLRFLRWKNKNLAIDRLRVSRRDKIMTSETELEVVADSRSPSDHLERAEDAAIVTLALAKMDQRHRYALIATAYEEKSISKLASELQLSPNASRQLIHRARRSFKISLKSVLEDKGISLESFLSGRFAKQLGLVSSIAGALVLIGIVNYGNLGSPSMTQVSLPQDLQEEVSTDAGVLEGQGDAQGVAPLDASQDLEAFPSAVGLVENGRLTEFDETYVQPAESESSGGSSAPPRSELSDRSESGLAQDRETLAMAQLAGPELLDSLITATSAIESATVAELSPGIVELQISSQARISVGYSMRDFIPTIDFFWLTLSPDEKKIVAVPQTLDSTVLQDANGDVLTLVATDFVLGDIGGHFGHTVNADSHLSFNGVLVKFEVQGQKLGVIQVSFSNRESDSA